MFIVILILDPFCRCILVRDGSLSFEDHAFQIMMFGIDGNKFPKCEKGDILRLHRYIVQFRRMMGCSLPQGLCKFNNRHADPQFVVIKNAFGILNSYIKSGTITPLSEAGISKHHSLASTTNGINIKFNSNSNSNCNSNANINVNMGLGRSASSSMSLSSSGSTSQPTIDDLRKYVEVIQTVEISQEAHAKHVKFFEFYIA